MRGRAGLPDHSSSAGEQTWLAMMLVVISLGFIINMSFVIVSRTAMVTIPVMMAVFALLHLKWRTSLTIFCGLVVLAGLAFAASPLLQQKAETVLRDYQLYKQANEPTSVGSKARILAEIAAVFC